MFNDMCERHSVCLDVLSMHLTLLNSGYQHMLLNKLKHVPFSAKHSIPHICDNMW